MLIRCIIFTSHILVYVGRTPSLDVCLQVDEL